MSKIEKMDTTLNSLRDLVHSYYRTKEIIWDNDKSTNKYFSLVNKIREYGNYLIFDGIVRYIFEVNNTSLTIIDLAISSNDMSVPYEKISLASLSNGNYVLFTGTLNIEILKEEAYGLYNIIKLKQMKYPYTISKTKDDKCYSIIDSSGNEMAFFNTYEEACSFHNSNFSSICNMKNDEVKIDENTNEDNYLEAFLNS